MKQGELFLMLSSLLGTWIEARPNPQGGVPTTIMTSIETRTTTIGGVTLTGEGYLSGDGGSFTPGSSFASAISSVTATMHPSTTGSSSPPSSAWTGPMTTSVPTGSGAGATNHPPVSTDAAAASRGESESDRQASTAVTSAGQLTTITVAPTSTTTRQLLVMGGTTYVEPGLYSLQLSMYSVLSGNSEDVAYYTQHNQPFDSANPPWATFITTTLLHTAASSGPTGSSGSSEPDTTFPAMAVYGASKTVMSGTTFYPYDEFQSLVASAWVSGSSAALASFTEANGVVVPSSSTLSTDPVQTTSGGNVAETGSAESEHAPSTRRASVASSANSASSHFHCSSYSWTAGADGSPTTFTVPCTNSA